MKENPIYCLGSELPTAVRNSRPVMPEEAGIEVQFKQEVYNPFSLEKELEIEKMVSLKLAERVGELYAETERLKYGKRFYNFIRSIFVWIWNIPGTGETAP